MICSGFASRSVHKRAWVSNSSLGSRIKTQRNGTAGNPVEYQSAVSETTSTSRSSSPYQWASVIGVQSMCASSVTAERLGKRSPLSQAARPTNCLTSGLLPRLGDGADLPHQTQVLGDAPRLGDLTSLYAIYRDAPKVHPIAGRRDAHVLPLVGCLGPPVGYHLVPLGYEVLYGAF